MKGSSIEEALANVREAAELYWKRSRTKSA
jgi:predicted RNase H-like HicB family nuclease